jgi:hypothetical protein
MTPDQDADDCVGHSRGTVAWPCYLVREACAGHPEHIEGQPA